MIGVSDGFHNAAFGQIINPIVRLYVSFDKQLTEGGFFTLDDSELDGPDLLKFSASDADTQSWDFYDYIDYTDRLVSASWERRLEFPYTVQAGMADFTLSNTDGYFTPLSPKSPIGENNLPSRPLKLLAGFSYSGTTELAPQMMALTDGMPDVNSGSRTADYHAVDFLYEIGQTTLDTSIVMRDTRTDLAIAALLESYGLAPSQYHLEPGKYTIPFVFFDVGASIGDALKKLVQSENGYMWLDETGVVRFTPASTAANDFSDIVANLQDYQIVSISPGQLTDVVNHVKVTAEVREIQEWQEIYARSSSIPTSPGQASPSNMWSIEPGDSLSISCGLGNPCYEVIAPTLGKASAVSWFTAVNYSLAQVTSGITATGVLSSTTYTITFTNSNSFPVIIDEMKIWGEPAKVYDVLDYEAYDDVSVAKYGDHLLEVNDNQFFQTYEQADNYAKNTIRQYSDYIRTVEAEIKGDFSFQLLDLVRISTAKGDYNDVYRIMGIAYSWNGSLMTTRLTLSGIGFEEGVFTLNMSKLNGEDLLA